MDMSKDELVTAFGLLLCLIAIVGGGFEFRGLKLPRVGCAIRLVASVAGVAFVVTGLAFHETGTSLASGTTHTATPTQQSALPRPNPTPVPVSTPIPTASQQEVTFTIRDQLGEDQISEAVSISIDGGPSNSIVINTDYPDATLQIHVSQAGKHSYAIQAASISRTPLGPVEYDEGGQGVINVRDGSQFDLVVIPIGLTLQVVLQERI